jgi:hypothetical protein
MRSGIAVGSTLKKCFSVMMLLALIAAIATAPVEAEGLPETAIVWVADVSGSVLEIDSQRYWADALSLGVDLAPGNTRAAFIAVNVEVAARTPLLDVSQAGNRTEIIMAAQNVAISGYTDFGLGLAAALELLEASSAKSRHIFVVGDFVESGYMYRDGNYSHVPDDMAALTKRLADAGIKVHLLFMREPVHNLEFVPLWEELADKTGGNLIPIANPEALPGVVQTLYFQMFGNNYTVSTGINTSDIAQDIPVRIPDLGLSRARIYIPFGTPVRGMQAHSDRGRLSFSETRSYFMIDLMPPMPDMVMLTLPPNENNNVRVYMLAEGGITSSAVTESSAEIDPATRLYRQITQVKVTPLVNNAPIYSGSAQPDVKWTLTATDPGGQSTNIDTATFVGGALAYEFIPEAFGTYSFYLNLESQGISLSAETSAELFEIELPVTWRQRINEYAIWIALAIGALLIIAAILFARSRRKRAASEAQTLHYIKPAPPADPAPIGHFAGKLDIYGVLVDGGKVEIPAMSARLEVFSKHKSITLETVLEQAGVPYKYPAASQITLQPGKDNALEVKNKSNAVIYCGGQPRSSGQQAVLVYGQKMRVVFDSEVSEYDIFYHNATKFAVSGDHIHVETTQ